eukprot:g2027.t1
MRRAEFAKRWLTALTLLAAVNLLALRKVTQSPTSDDLGIRPGQVLFQNLAAALDPALTGAPVVKFLYQWHKKGGYAYIGFTAVSRLFVYDKDGTDLIEEVVALRAGDISALVETLTSWKKHDRDLLSLHAARERYVLLLVGIGQDLRQQYPVLRCGRSACPNRTLRKLCEMRKIPISERYALRPLWVIASLMLPPQLQPEPLNLWEKKFREAHRILFCVLGFGIYFAAWCALFCGYVLEPLKAAVSEGATWEKMNKRESLNLMKSTSEQGTGTEGMEEVWDAAGADFRSLFHDALSLQFPEERKGPKEPRGHLHGSALPVESMLERNYRHRQLFGAENKDAESRNGASLLYGPSAFEEKGVELDVPCREEPHVPVVAGQNLRKNEQFR